VIVADHHAVIEHVEEGFSRMLAAFVLPRGLIQKAIIDLRGFGADPANETDKRHAECLSSLVQDLKAVV
jgi:hypothetical protein